MRRLLTRPPFALFWLAGLVSSIGDWLLLVALPVHVYAVSESVLASGAMFLAGTLPRVLVGPLAGVLVDRWDRRRVMIVTDVARAAVLVSLVFVDSPATLWIVYGVAVAQAVLTVLFSTAHAAFLPTLVAPSELVPANAALTLARDVTRVVAPAGGAFLVALVQLPGIVLIDGATFLLSALLLALVRPEGRAERRAAPPRVRGDGKAAEAFVRSRPIVAALFVVTGVSAFGEGVFNVSFVPFVQRAGWGEAAFGLIVSAQGVGGVVGAALAPRLARRALTAVVRGAVAQGAAIVLVALAVSWPVTLAVFALVGLPMAARGVAAQSRLQRDVDDAFRGRVFGLLGTVSSFGLLLGQGSATLLGDRLGPSTLLLVAGGAHVTAGLVLAAWRTRPGLVAASTD